MFCEILTFLLIYILINCFLWYRKRIDSHQRFIRKGIKGPKPTLISGNLYQLRLKDTPNEVIDDWIQEYGNHFGYFLGDKPFLVINDLDSIQRILITNNKLFRDRPKTHINAKPFVDSLMCLRGDDWRRVRRVITPFFSHHKVCSKEITDIIINSVNTFIKDVEECKTSIIEVSDRMQSITLDVICKCALNIFDNDVHQKDSQLKSAAQEFMESAQNVAVDAAVFFPFLRPILAFINNYMTAGRMTDMIIRHLNKQIKFETQSISSKSNNFQTNTKSNNMLISMLNSYLQQKITKDELIGKL
jgi:cytochrome P450